MLLGITPYFHTIMNYDTRTENSHSREWDSITFISKESNSLITSSNTIKIIYLKGTNSHPSN